LYTIIKEKLSLSYIQNGGEFFIKTSTTFCSAFLIALAQEHLLLSERNMKALIVVHRSLIIVTVLLS